MLHNTASYEYKSERVTRRNLRVWKWIDHLETRKEKKNLSRIPKNLSYIFLPAQFDYFFYLGVYTATGYFRKVYRTLQVRVPHNIMKYLSIQKLPQSGLISLFIYQIYKKKLCYVLIL